MKLLAALLLFSIACHAQERAKPVARFLDSIGVDVHLNYVDTAYGNTALVEQEVQRLGVMHLRDGIGATGYPEVKDLGKLGVRFALNVPAPYSAAALNAALAAANINGVQPIEAWEGWNEMDAWDSNWRTDFGLNFALLKAANTAGIATLGPPLADARNAAQLAPVQASYGTFHPYPAGQNPSAFIAQQMALIQPLFPGAPIIASETGYHNALNDHRDQPGIDLATGAKYEPRLLLENFNAGVYRTYLYELLDERSAGNTTLQDTNGNCEQCNWGLVTAAGVEKPAFVAVSNVISILGHGAATTIYAPGSLTYTLSGSTAVHHTLLQKAPGVFDLVLWQDASSWDTTAQKPISNPNQPAILTVSASSVVGYLPSDSLAGTVLPIVNGQVTLSVPDEPLILEIVTAK